MHEFDTLTVKVATTVFLSNMRKYAIFFYLGMEGCNCDILIQLGRLPTRYLIRKACAPST
jgi:hypothetical protein